MKFRLTHVASNLGLETVFQERVQTWTSRLRDGDDWMTGAASAIGQFGVRLGVFAVDLTPNSGRCQRAFRVFKSGTVDRSPENSLGLLVVEISE